MFSQHWMLPLSYPISGLRSATFINDRYKKTSKEKVTHDCQVKLHADGFPRERFVMPDLFFGLFIAKFLIRLVQTEAARWWQFVAVFSSANWQTVHWQFPERRKVDYIRQRSLEKGDGGWQMYWFTDSVWPEEVAEFRRSGPKVAKLYYSVNSTYWVAHPKAAKLYYFINFAYWVAQFWP